jgi:hypothetical protein
MKILKVIRSIFALILILLGVVSIVNSDTRAGIICFAFACLVAYIPQTVDFLQKVKDKIRDECP